MKTEAIELNRAEESLKRVLSKYKSLAIAISGGADSTFLATFAIKNFPIENIFLFHAKLPFSPKNETKLVKEWAKDNCVKLEVLELDILQNDDVKKNNSRRCYYCKKSIMSALICEVRKLGIANIADGTVLDDFGDYRPGLEATAELGIVHPLADAGFDKKTTRILARQYGLKNWNMPASACLASRIPYDTPLDKDVLDAVGDGEEFLTSLGFPGSRIRVYDNMRATIEVNPIYLSLLLKKREPVIKKLKQIGFNNVLLDLEGYRRGSLNSGAVLQ